MCTDFYIPFWQPQLQLAEAPGDPGIESLSAAWRSSARSIPARSLGSSFRAPWSPDFRMEFTMGVKVPAKVRVETAEMGRFRGRGRREERYCSKARRHQNLGRGDVAMKSQSLLGARALRVQDSSFPPWTAAPAKLLCTWGFPDKNSGVGCHFLLQGIFPTKGLNSRLLGLLK